MALIELNDVWLQFRIRQQRKIPLKDFLLRGLFRPGRNPVMVVNALHAMNLQVRDGERLGIIGHNGAGKSTLLKLLAGIYPPTRGRRHVEGRISSLFDLQLGFEPEASGWDNIAYRGYLQGETPKTLGEKIDAIAEFSELGEFLESPVRFYSAGMRVRLAFAVATAIEPEVLLVDEVLSAGDEGFQRKARERMLEMIEKAQVIVMVSHDLEALREFCNRAIWMDHGQVRMDGPVNEVIDTYIETMANGGVCPGGNLEAAA